ncbi:Alpha/beta hydrolase family protein [Rubripirellula obstinata]|uniref:Alpha/beta hydrolase family protein n=1 Tax=Rubripirellula obstinata TaxID=406547 RepID=A0A5B1CJ75_9BACT|nr:alpha/beta hydrolase [Rubripirellula obstinata]KAA1259344.1 Alpha/beta hydrolase family protein [Rubripirellula obstinata]
MTQFNFTNRHGQTLAGRMELPDGKPTGHAIFAHCFTCSKNAKAASRISKELAEHGIAALRFDFTGLGNSEGDFANTNFSSNVDDLMSAADAMAAQQMAPSLLIGHSLGGAASLMAAEKIDSIRAVATIGAPSEPAHVSHLFGDQVAAIEEDGCACVSIGGRKLRIQKHFLEDIQSNRVGESLADLKKPLMIFHSPIDTIVSIENARQIYNTARHPKSFVSIDGANHMLDDPADARFVAAMLATWADRYVVT